MGSVICEVMCSVVILVGFAGVMITLLDSKWEVQDLETIRLPGNAEYRGLWIRCDPDSSGSTTCWPYKSFFIGLPSKLQAGRGFAITALTLSLFASALCFSSISTISCASDNPAVRNRIRIFGAICGISAGISLLAGASWYASEVLNEYYTRLLNNQDTRNVLGEAIFIGWGSSALLIFGGILAACISCKSDDDGDEYNSRNRDAMYVPSKTAKEYV